MPGRDALTKPLRRNNGEEVLRRKDKVHARARGGGYSFSLIPTTTCKKWNKFAAEKKKGGLRREKPLS